MPSWPVTVILCMMLLPCTGEYLAKNEKKHNNGLLWDDGLYIHTNNASIRQNCRSI